MNKIVWLTDPHLVDSQSTWPAGVDPLTRFRRCIDDIREHHADADRLVISGDLVQLRNPSGYPILRQELEALSIPWRLLVGNHDDRSAFREFFPEAGHHDAYIQSAEDLANTRILYLDTVARDGKHHGELCQERIDWIAEHMESANERLMLVFMHHPPFGLGVPALDRLKLLDADGLAALLKGRRHPTHLFCGHVHRNASGLWAGHPFASLKSPHVQFDLDMKAPNLIRSAEPPGYGVIISRGEEVTVNYRDVPGL